MPRFRFQFPLIWVFWLTLVVALGALMARERLGERRAIREQAEALARQAEIAARKIEAKREVDRKIEAIRNRPRDPEKWLRDIQ